jgi:hypothetical protein
VRVGSGQIRIQGSIPSGHFVQYDGGEVATIFDENWHRQGELHVEKMNAGMPSGSAVVSLGTEQPRPWPWLDVQFLTTGATIPVGK